MSISCLHMFTMNFSFMLERSWSKKSWQMNQYEKCAHLCPKREDPRADGLSLDFSLLSGLQRGLPRVFTDIHLSPTVYACLLALFFHAHSMGPSHLGCRQPGETPPHPRHTASSASQGVNKAASEAICGLT